MAQFDKGISCSADSIVGLIVGQTRAFELFLTSFLPQRIAADRFVAPSLGRKRPIGRCTAAGSVGRGIVRLGSQRYRAAQPDCLPYPAAARFLLGSCPA